MALCRHPVFNLQFTIPNLQFAILLSLVVGSSLPTSPGVADEQKQERYSAVLTDGRRISGDEVTDWGRPDGSPRLANQPLLQSPTPVRWLLDNALPASQTPDAFVEFWNADRLPGTVVETCVFGTDASDVMLPDHLVVEPQIELLDRQRKALPYVRVVLGMVRRIVWEPAADDRYRPATVFFRDGRRLEFRRHRFLDAGLSLLTESGVQSVGFDEIAEFHAPRIDPWEAYYDEVAVLSPQLEERLFQLETTTGLIATASAPRFEVASYSDAGQPDRWWHLIQPAWSLDALAVNYREIRLRRYFAADEVPLWRIEPIHAVNRSALHADWRRQTNRSVVGRPLESGPQGYGWGFGVHGLCELTFPLPPIVQRFRTQLKLDASAGSGGCVRASVFAGVLRPGEDAGAQRSRQRLYQSSLLIGSKDLLDTGNLQLKRIGPDDTALLTLAVDPVYNGHPKDADPLDIRDMLNWLEPTVLLDRAALAEAVRRRQAEAIWAWQGWTLEDPDRRAFRLHSLWEAMPGQGAGFRFAVASDGPLVLSRSVRVGSRQKWLILSAGRPAEETPGSIVEVRIDGEPAAEYEVPVRTPGRKEPSPLVVPLEALAGQSVRFQIVQRPIDANAKGAAVDWRAITFADRLPMLSEVFEDGAAWELLPDEGEEVAEAELQNEDAYSGTGCLRITPGGRCRIELADGPAAIRERPRWGEYRYLRFAFRKRGQGQVRIELGHDGEQDRKLQYFAGRGDPGDESAKRVWIWSTHADLPDAWIVETCDLHGDFNRFSGNVTSVTLSCTGGDEVLFDHVYLARTIEDLERVQVDRVATPDQAARAARAAMVEPSLEKAFPATVLLRGNGRTFSGVIVSPEGHVLTAGHCAMGPSDEVTVTLHDGRSLAGKRLGVDRANNTAMVKILDEGEYPFLKIADSGYDLLRELLLGVAHQVDFEPGRRPLAHLTWTTGEVDGLLWTNFGEPIVGSGGPLLIATNASPGEGRLVGVHGRSQWGKFLYTPIAKYQEHWDRLEKGDVWGQWAPGTGPLLGIFTAEEPNVCKISQLVPEGPAEKAGLRVGDVIQSIDGQPVADSDSLAPVLAAKDPGQEVQVKIDRDGKALDVQLVLGASR